MGIIIAIVNAIVSVLTFIVFVYVVLRYFMDPYHPLIIAMGRVIEPMLAPIRKYVPPISGFDFSPIVFMIILQVVGSIVTALMRRI